MKKSCWEIKGYSIAKYRRKDFSKSLFSNPRVGGFPPFVGGRETMGYLDLSSPSPPLSTSFIQIKPSSPRSPNNPCCGPPPPYAQIKQCLARGTQSLSASSQRSGHNPAPLPPLAELSVLPFSLSQSHRPDRLYSLLPQGRNNKCPLFPVRSRYIRAHIWREKKWREDNDDTKVHGASLPVVVVAAI